jgi:hypothetical protein
MTKSEHYHMQPRAGYTQAGRIQCEGKDVTWKIEPQAKMVKCSCCGPCNVDTRGSETRVIRGVPALGTKLIFFQVKIPIAECRERGMIRQIDPGISEPKKRFTKAFARAVILLALTGSMNSAANLLGVTWYMVNGIFQSYLKKKHTEKILEDVLRTGIDETWIGRKRKFVTVVLDPDTGDPIFRGGGQK